MTGESTATLRDALVSLRGDAGLGGEDASRWVRTRIGPIPFAYPNTRGRKRVLAAHDLHHILAGYGTDLLGEAELAAWELGSGLRDRSAVRYAIRVFGFMVPRRWSRLRSAFVRGRHSRNLADRALDGEALQRTVEEMRRELGLADPTPSANGQDLRAFRAWAAKGVAIVWGPLIPIALAIGWWLR